MALQHMHYAERKQKGLKKERAYQYSVGPENAQQSTAMQNPCLV